MPTGGTQRQHLERLAKKGHAGATATLAEHPLPPMMAPLYRDFHEMDRWRGSGGFGPNPLSLADVEAFERRLRARPYLPGELRLLKQLDFVSLAAAPKGKPDA